MRALIYTYPRSGTHYFCSLVKRWFYPDRDMGGAVEPVAGVNWEGSDKPWYAPWAQLFGGHYYDPRCSAVHSMRSGFKQIYLIRDGRDVMVSVWKLEQAIAKEAGAKPTKFSDRLRAAANFPTEFPWVNPPPPTKGQPFTTPLLWWWSSGMWLAQPTETLEVVEYADLLTEEGRDRVRQRLGRYLGFVGRREEDEEIRRAEETRPRGIGPREKPGAGQWKEHFSREDIKFWEEERDKAQEMIDGDS